MPGSILGTEVRRVEDPELLLGQGTFVDNLDSEGVAHAVFVRSPFAHARITGIDTSEAGAAAGRAGGLHRRRPGPRAGSRASPTSTSRRRARPSRVDKVRYVGDPVALVVAETRAQAVDAAELVDVDYDDLPVGHRHRGRPGRRTRRCSSRRSARNIATCRGRTRHRRRRWTTPTTSSARPDGQPAHRHRPDRGQRDPGRGPTERRASRPGSRPSTRTWPATCSPRPSASTQEHVRVVAPHVGGAFGGKAGIRPRPRRGRHRRPHARPAGEVDRDPQRGDALDARPRPGAVRRARAHRDGTHHRPAAAGRSASAARTPASAARWRSGRRT